MKIGILGGGFDPPHLGHLWMAQQILEKIELDQVWLVPYNERNLNKVQSSNNLQRLEMTRLAIRGHKKLKVLDWEIKRGGITYTIDTVRELLKKYPEDEFYLIIGEDLVIELPKWKEYESLIKLIKFLVFPRTGKGIETCHGMSLQIIKPEVITNLSSTIIRERVKNGLSINRMVRKGVEHYIFEHKLYK